ncbi:MAG: EamA family transporter [Candidatus Melainabacteria bacterium]|nr:EamA family transporter [Candidatus Melainabacteria bacterium]
MRWTTTLLATTWVQGSTVLEHWAGLALMSLFCMGTGNFLMRLATAWGKPPWAACLIQVSCMLLVMVAVAFFRHQSPWSAWDRSAGTWAAMGGGLFIALGALLVVSAFAKPGAVGGVVTAILNANFSWVLLLGFLFLREAVTLKQLLGMLTVLLGIVLLV